MIYIVESKEPNGSWYDVGRYRSKAAANAHASMERRRLRAAGRKWRGIIRIRSIDF